MYTITYIYSDDCAGGIVGQYVDLPTAQAVLAALQKHGDPGLRFVILDAVPTVAPSDELYTSTQAAIVLGVSRRRVTALIASGRLPAQHVGFGWLIKAADLDRVKTRQPGRPKKPVATI